MKGGGDAVGPFFSVCFFFAVVAVVAVAGAVSVAVFLDKSTFFFCFCGLEIVARFGCSNKIFASESLKSDMHLCRCV